MSISIEVSDNKYQMILSGIESLQTRYFNSGNKTMADRASDLYSELRKHQIREKAENTKLLVVDIQNPGSTMYRNANTIASFFLSRRISNYLLFIVGDDNKTQQIVLTSSEYTEIQSQVLNQIYNFS
jgi:uncharacterized UPF0146 family protein